MAQENSRLFGEIISIFMLLMLCLALIAGQARSAAEAHVRSFSDSVTNAGNVAAEPRRRSADAGPRLFD